MFQAKQLLTATAVAALLTAGSASAALKVGDTAPNFTLPGSNGADTTLYEVLGEQIVVLAFYPKAFTGG